MHTRTYDVHLAIFQNCEIYGPMGPRVEPIRPYCENIGKILLISLPKLHAKYDIYEPF